MARRAKVLDLNKLDKLVDNSLSPEEQARVILDYLATFNLVPKETLKHDNP